MHATTKSVRSKPQKREGVNIYRISWPKSTAVSITTNNCSIWMRIMHVCTIVVFFSSGGSCFVYFPIAAKPTVLQQVLVVAGPRSLCPCFLSVLKVAPKYEDASASKCFWFSDGWPPTTNTSALETTHVCNRFVDSSREGWWDFSLGGFNLGGLKERAAHQHGLGGHACLGPSSASSLAKMMGRGHEYKLPPPPRGYGFLSIQSCHNNNPTCNKTRSAVLAVI